jgi:EpsI family protein
MTPGKPSRILLAAAIVVAAQAGARYLDVHYAPGDPSPPRRKLTELPHELGPWMGVDAPMPETFERATGAMEMVNRTYAAPAGENVLLNCGVWIDYSTVLPHSPEACYPAAGWEVLDKRSIEVACPDGPSAFARLLILRRDAEELAVVYWCHLGDAIVVDHAPVRELRQRLRGTGERLPAAVKVTLQMPLSTWTNAEQSVSRLAGLVMAETAKIR